MTRLIHEGENLKGQTLDARTQPDGHARQSYFGKATLKSATLIGDFRGSDFPDADIRGANMAKAMLGGTRLDGAKVDGQTVIPTDIGALNREFCIEVVRRQIEAVVADDLKGRAYDAIAAIRDVRFLDFRDISRDLASTAHGRDGITGLLESLRPWPSIHDYVKQALSWFAYNCAAATPQEGGKVIIGRSPTIAFPDGVRYTLDADNLPKLSHPYYRYELDRLIEREAGSVLDPDLPNQERHVWTASIRPFPWLIDMGTDPDRWLGEGLLRERWL